MADEVIRVEGLAELRRGLKDADVALPKALSEAHKKVATLVVAGAQPKATTKHGKRARSRIAASGTQTGAAIRIVGPTAFGDEFGADRYHQFKPHTRDGYAVYPTIRERRAEIEDMYLDAVYDSLTRRAFPE